MYLNLDIFKIKTNNIAPKKGRILIAEPFLPGSYFNRAIVFLVDHNEEGTVGFILNKPVDFQVEDFQKEFPNYNHPVYLGGPVNIDSLYYVHSLGKLITNSVPISTNLSWGGDYGQLQNLIQKGIATKDNVRFFLGYSGWEKNQLKEELEEDSWLVADISDDIVLANEKKLWKKMVKEQGGIYALWENFPENPSMN